MRRILFLFIIICPFWSSAQSVDLNPIVNLDNVEASSFEEKLVSLAWQNSPSNKIFQHQVNISAIEVKQARWSWLDNFKAQGNLNEFVLNDRADIEGRSAFFPKYNVSAQVSLGYFVNIPLEVKKNKDELMIARLTEDQQKLNVRAEILTRYQDYLVNKELLRIQTEITEDVLASLSLSEQKFKDGEITFSEYNKEQERYNNQRVKMVVAQGSYNISKISVEEMIGVKLERVE